MAKRQTLNTIIAKIVKRYIKHIKTRGINVDSALVFGSWAKGRATDESDIDICLISRDFGRNEIREQQLLLYETHKIDDRIEPVPVSTKDFETDATPFILEIKKYGQMVNIE